ncbi:MAG TPA: S8 family serine peptidase [Lacipirellula sp.]
MQVRSYKRSSSQIERLEARHMMSAAALGGELVHHDLDDPALTDGASDEQLSQHVLGSPDFWISPEDSDALNAAFDEVEQALTQAHNQTGWFNVRSDYGFTGLGQTVAVIDSGIAYNHFALGGGFGSNYRVIDGWDFSEGDWNPADDGPEGGHGTHVSGIIGSTSSTNTGVAPGVNLVGLRVFDDSGAGYFSWVESALQWVHANRNKYANSPITAVNLSLGVSSWNSASIPAWANLEDEFAQLEADGIFIAVSAGNAFTSYGTPGLSYPASSSYVVPVMSTDDNGLLSSYSQRLDRAIAAPGRSITSTIPDYMGNNNGVQDDFGAMSGTSMAAPYIAGASVLIRQAMQFVGMTNITQDVIYNHMMATADSIFDAATNAYYKRLDLEAAIDALMPADDFGSSLATANDLGTLSSSVSRSGAIGTLTDSDYFRFTAGATGNVTFNVTAAQQQMAASWQILNGTGQSIVTVNGNSVTFAVTAGQTYVARLSSTGGMGHYSFTATAASSASTNDDWGVVDYDQIADVSISGEKYYRVVAAHTGILTVQGEFDSAAGSFSMQLYTSGGRKITDAYRPAADCWRINAGVVEGAEYYVRVDGNHSDVDFTVMNLVQRNGSSVTIHGADGDDAYTFHIGGAFFLGVNGIQYYYTGNIANKFHFVGGDGNDSVILRGGAQAETATMRDTNATLGGAAYFAASYGFETQTVYGGGGGDVVYLYDSAGDDDLSSWSHRATMSGAGYSNEALGFGAMYAISTAGGNDEAVLYDTAGDDLFSAGPARAILWGNGFYNETRGFARATARATEGGYDRATLYDSSGNETLNASQQLASVVGATFNNSVQNFERVEARMVNGGQNTLNIGATDYAFSLYGQSASSLADARTTGISSSSVRRLRWS